MELYLSIIAMMLLSFLPSVLALIGATKNKRVKTPIHLRSPLKVVASSVSEGEQRQIAEEKRLARLSLCRHCGGTLKIVTGECRACGRGSIMACNKCGGKVLENFPLVCKDCGKSFYECLYCQGKMKYVWGIKDYLCKSCDRVRAY